VQNETLKSAVATLDKQIQSNNRATTSDAIAAQTEKAIRTLRFLGTVDATREMARRLTSEDRTISSECFFGLAGSTHRGVAISELQRLFANPGYPITHNFVSAMTTLMRNPDQSLDAVMEQDSQNYQTIIESLQPVISRKRGKALALTVATVLEMTGSKTGHVSDEMVKQVALIFDQLPVEKQVDLLDSRWESIGGPAFLPLLRKYALGYKDSPGQNERDAHYSWNLSNSALLRWYELEPTEARQVIIREILRPEPRYSARTLGVLPDETLPEVEQALMDHFTKASGESSDLASLIARYGTDSIMPQMVSIADKHIGKWGCGNQASALAYLLRVDPETARPRLEAAIAARGDEFTACNHQLFTEVADMRQDPLLEELAIRALDDDDPEVAANAAKFLGQYGSTSAEQKLWERLTQWSEKWKDKAGELRYVMGDDNPNYHQRQLGSNLVEAIIGAKSWIVDESKLRRLRQLAVMPDVQEDLDRVVSDWAEKPWAITFMFSSGEPYFEVLRYEARSMKAIQEKLSNFPAGSTFFWRPALAAPGVDEKKVATELSDFLSSHGMKLIIPAN
jgi:hypothetical protein